MFKKCVLLILLFSKMSLLYSYTAQWVGGHAGDTNDWNQANNWTPTTQFPNAQDDVANFTTTSSFTPVNLNVAITVGQILFNAAQNYAVQPNGGSLIFNASSGSAALSGAGSGAYDISANITLSSDLSVTQSSTGNLTLSGTITGTHNISKSGSTTLILSGANSSYSGVTSINAGVLQISQNNGLGVTSNISIGTGTLQFDTSGGGISVTQTISLTGSAIVNVSSTANNGSLTGVVSGSGSFTKGNSGTLILTGTNTYTGGTVISAGTLRVSNDVNLGNTANTLTIGNATLFTTTGITSARSGSFSSTATIDNNAQTNTLSGNFSGTGSLTVTGGGTLNLTGTNSYTGPITIAAATTLTGTTSSLQGNIGNSGTLTFNQSSNGTYGGVLSGAGALNKNGTGIVTFTGASTFSGTTAINAGTLVVNGSLSGSAVTVGSSATLSGSGTVGATTSSGIIDPGQGDTTGHLTVSGALTLNAGARVNITIAPLTNDRIIATGAASLTGSLQVTPAPGFYGFSRDYVILTSSARSGTFSPVTTSNPNFILTVTNTATSVLLNVLIGRPFSAFPFSNENTAAVGNNIDDLYAAGQLSPDLTNVLNALIGQSNSVVNNALDQMHPALYSAFTEMQSEVTGQLVSLFHRLPYLPCACNNPNRLWAEGFGNTLTVKNHGIELGFQGNSGGIAFGYDGQVLENLVLGIGGAWSNNHLTWQRKRGHGDMNGLYGSLYFDSQIDSFYLGGTCLMGLDFYDTVRHIHFVGTDRKAKAHYNAFDLVAQIATAYLFGSPQGFFYPYANIDYLYLNTHKFKETGAEGLNLTVSNHTDGTLRTEMGLALQVQDTNMAETACISPLISIGWVNLSPIQRHKLKATFSGETIPFKVRGWDETWNLMNLNFALTFSYRCFSALLDYNVEFSPDKKTLLFNQHGNLRFDWKW